jgi:hypothetical protein
MKRMNFSWLATATMMAVVVAATPALPEDLPPILRITVSALNQI